MTILSMGKQSYLILPLTPEALGCFGNKKGKEKKEEKGGKKSILGYSWPVSNLLQMYISSYRVWIVSHYLSKLELVLRSFD